jgi:hypothetical protein
MGSAKRIATGVGAGCFAFYIGFHVGMAVYTLTPIGLFFPAEVFAGAFPTLTAAFRR